MFSSYLKQALTVMISPLCTNCHDITVILLNAALNTINLIFYLQRHIPIIVLLKKIPFFHIFHIFHIFSQFSTVFSKSFHYLISTYLSFIFSIQLWFLLYFPYLFPIQLGFLPYFSYHSLFNLLFFHIFHIN
jgi:hypothetical protein